MKSYKHLFTRFLQADPARLHLAAHSHHFWPDVSFEAQARAWTDAATLADDKWDRIFQKVWPRAQRHVARALRLPDAGVVSFGPNTHALVMRVLSCLPAQLRVLTTDGEFHSFARQLARLEEAGRAVVTRVPVRPFETFARRFAEHAQRGFDLVYFSQVFFDSGYALRDLRPLVEAAPASATVLVDGYHAFWAIDVDLRGLHDRVFYVAGGYKYAMSGEGCCFLCAPAGLFPRPVDTGWLAAFFALEERQDDARVPYAADGSRFLGATMDPTALYRFDAVMSLLDREGLTPRDIDERAKTLQDVFLTHLGAHASLGELVVPGGERGSFLAFETAHARTLHARLAERHVITDVRGDRLRVGFGLYHDEADAITAAERLAEVCAHVETG